MIKYSALIVLIIVSISCVMNVRNKVKQEIVWKNLKIRLLDVKKIGELPYTSESNIIAVNSLDTLVWKAEAPRTHYEQYFDMEIDKEKEVLIATTGSGYKHILSLENGKVLEYYLVK